MTYKIFGKINDEKKEKILSFRVSKKMHSYFETHAKEAYGDTTTGLKEIMFQYMENITYKRGTIYNNPMFIILPKEDIINEQAKIRDTKNEPPFNPCEEYNKINDITKVKIYDHIESYILENRPLDSEEDIRDIVRAYSKDGYIIAHFYLNNYLDKFNKGIYSLDSNHQNAHRGFIMFECDNQIYNIVLTYELDENGLLKSGKANIISNSDAYNLAKEKDNIQLAKIIDKYNHESTNIEQNIDDLKNKKKELERQLKEVNRQIKMLR